MTPRERVHAALARQPVDRVPIFMWFHPDAARRLAGLLEIPAGRLSEAMGDDVRQTWVGNNHAMEGIVHEREGDSHVDDWGVDWVRVGPFNQIRTSPLQDASPERIRAYRFPHHRIDALLRNMEPVVAFADRYFVGCDVSPCLFEMVCRLRGMEHAALDLAADVAQARSLLERAADFCLAVSRAACQRFPLDWFWTGDDVGGQQAMIMSPQRWRELIRPHLERIFFVGKEFGLWVAYHSCGAIRPIIPDLIEIGLDVLNPVQCNCPGMDPIQLKREFGAHLSFMGGVDTQDLLPNGTADDVRRETEHLLEIMTDGGGYILAASHAIPPETPVENIFSMYAAAGVSREEIADRAASIRAASTAPPSAP